MSVTPRASGASVEGVSERYENGFRVLSVDDPNALTQVIGWLKFTSRNGDVLFRGQVSLPSDMMSSGLRGRNATGRANLATRLNAFVREAVGPCTCLEGPFKFRKGHLCVEQVARSSGSSAPVVNKTYRAAVEPLLQHYGIKTRWLDVVDNVWVALWFACHKQVAVENYAYYLRRSVAQEGVDSKAYIVVLETGVLDATDVPGYRVGANARVVDLRYAVPSVYLRPHAQHGLLMAPLAVSADSRGSLRDQVAAVVEVHTRDALEWLGTGAMTSPFVLFPPAARDEGYRRLLEYAPKSSSLIGAITHYGPGY